MVLEMKAKKNNNKPNAQIEVSSNSFIYLGSN